MDWDVSDLTAEQRAELIEEQTELLKTLERRQAERGYEVGTDARHELDLEILEGFHLLEALKG